MSSQHPAVQLPCELLLPRCINVCIEFFCTSLRCLQLQGPPLTHLKLRLQLQGPGSSEGSHTFGKAAAGGWSKYRSTHQVKAHTPGFAG